MASDHARIARSIWLDEDFLDRSLPAQWLYMHLLSSPGLTFAGVLDWRPKRIAQRSQTATVDVIEAALAELQEYLFVLLDEDTEEVMIRSYARGDGLLKQPNMAVAYVKAFSLIGSRTLRSVAVYELHRLKKDHPDLKGWSLLKDIMRFAGTDPREAYLRLNGGREPDQEADLPALRDPGIVSRDDRQYVY
jgi:hypothetical protein